MAPGRSSRGPPASPEKAKRRLGRRQRTTRALPSAAMPCGWSFRLWMQRSASVKELKVTKAQGDLASLGSEVIAGVFPILWDLRCLFEASRSISGQLRPSPIVLRVDLAVHDGSELLAGALHILHSPRCIGFRSDNRRKPSGSFFPGLFRFWGLVSCWFMLFWLYDLWILLPVIARFSNSDG